jgi:hypothetical protein
MYQRVPPRHALSMCHTIHDTSLKQTRRRHTFTREEELIHTISDSVTTLLYHHTFLQPELTIILQIWLSLVGQMSVITRGLA